MNLQPLDKKFRGQLERTVKEARDVAEEAARAACKQLGVGRAKPDAHLTDDEKDLRRRLRIHGRQLGDKRDPQKETQQLDRLVDEIAYEHWHRMLFARFLAENHLLMYPDPDDPVSVSIDDCNDLAADEGAKNGWELAARFASRMLPQIFRLESPVFALTLPPENQQQLERLLSELPDEVFTASDSLGWVYQFWQTKRKDEVNASEVKIGARELPAVTQLFTEPYMVSFLLDNSLGAWWAARRLSDEDLSTAENEQELRDIAALPGVPLDYLRFIKDEESGRWTPAAGTFDSWPESLAELKTLDPCCGSGHFLVAALLMLTPMRMELESLTAREAVDRILSENLHGLEIDQRCVELAAFALALAAWQFPEAGGYRSLPELNVACCGLSLSIGRDEWKALAQDNKLLRIALGWMHDEFKDAPVLGSLLNPASSNLPLGIHWSDIAPSLNRALEAEQSTEQQEATTVAQGLARAALLMASRFSWVVTNVPYLVRSKQSKKLQDACEGYDERAKNELATVFHRRCLDYCDDVGTVSLVLPQNWLFQRTYRSWREYLLQNMTWHCLAMLGPGAFDEITGEVVKAVLICGSKARLSEDFLGDQSDQMIHGIDVANYSDTTAKAFALRTEELAAVSQKAQLSNPEARIVLAAIDSGALLERYANSYQGVKTGDDPRYRFTFWEVESFLKRWLPFQSTVKEGCLYGGITDVIDWRDDGEHHARRQGLAAWERNGASVAQMGDLPASIYFGTPYDSNVSAIVPKNMENALAVWAFCSSPTYGDAVRTIDRSMGAKNAAMAQVPFDLAHWQQIAAEKYPHGLPQPYSDNPTQWIFHGHPASSEHALQVAVARLLGYRWPAELDDEMELAADARVWVQRSSELNDLADSDGIVCVPAVGTEQPAEDRLLNLLHKAYKDGRTIEEQFQEKLHAGDTNDSLSVALLQRDWQPSLPGSFNDWLSSLLESADHTGKTLGSWLREKFFTQHSKRFDHRPFIWHIWDGLKDGFSVLVNYHRLDNKLLKTLIYTYLNDWINRQKQGTAAGVDGSEEKLAAAEWLKERLEQILHGESPHDIFVRWKPIDEQPFGWNPDLNDGVRLNIRPWLTVGDVKKKGAGLLRDKPNIHWKKDRGKDVENAPWYHLGPEFDGKEGDRINDHHLTLEEKQAARNEMEAGS